MVLKYSLAFVVLAVVLPSCVSVTPVSYKKDTAAAVDAMTRYRALFNEERYEDLYKMTDPRAKATKSKDAFIDLTRTIRTQLGKAVNPLLVDTKVEPKATFTEVTLTYETTFENGIQRELFVWYVAKDTAGLYSFTILPNE